MVLSLTPEKNIGEADAAPKTLEDKVISIAGLVTRDIISSAAVPQHTEVTFTPTPGALYTAKEMLEEAVRQEEEKARIERDRALAKEKRASRKRARVEEEHRISEDRIVKRRRLAEANHETRQENWPLTLRCVVCDSSWKGSVSWLVCSACSTYSLCSNCRIVDEVVYQRHRAGCPSTSS